MDNSYNYVARNIYKIKEQINNEAILIIAVSKTVTCETAALALEVPGVELGENRVQEFLKKYEYFQGKAKIHLIGHLQKNKVKYIIGKTPLIHSVDSQELLEEIQKRSSLQQVITDVLIQVKIYDEETKYGADEKDVINLIHYNESNPNVKIKGLMTMAPFTENEQIISQTFRKLNDIFVDIRKNTFYNTDMVYLSMGMSNDFMLAAKEGANVLRIGSAIFKDIP
ncbi:MAG: YggS family pyridoxal phosphate-dependent enzyme [Clostridia bacterium]